MELCLVRHGIASERGAGVADDDRKLTERGRARMELGAAGLSRIFQADVILTSPLVRAVQTAEILMDALGLRGITKTDALAWGDDERLFQELGELGDMRVVAVGHEPHMSRTLSYALTGDHGLVHSVFKKGGAALMSFDGTSEQGRGWLEWMLQPSALRGLAGATG